MIAAFNCSVLQVGCTFFTRAAMPAVSGVAIDVPDSTTTPLPDPIFADATVSPGAVTSGLTTPIEPWVPREVKDEIVSAMAGDRSLMVATSDPENVTFRVPASTAGRSRSVPVFGNWNTGIRALPVIPAPNFSRPEVKIAPIAPAFWTLPDRPAEPHRRVASLSSHSSQATLPATVAASAGDSGSQPSALASESGTTSPVTSGAVSHG